MPVVSLNIPEGELQKPTDYLNILRRVFWLIAVGGNISVEGVKQINYKNLFKKKKKSMNCKLR